jgi:K+-transporting ATPase ATPase A chain
MFSTLLLFTLFLLVVPVAKWLVFLYRPAMNWETPLFNLLKINPYSEMSAKEYLNALLLFNGIGLVFLFLLLVLQGHLPLNHEKFEGLNLDLAFNTAISFVTNTNWQAYAGESTLSYFSQMIGLTVQNFLSAATGLSLSFAFIRSLLRENQTTLGNFWTDVIRSTLFFLLPLSLVFALILGVQGVIQNIHPYVSIETMENEALKLPMGPVASQVAIKQLGSNGGGFFNANSAHPFENPSLYSNFLETLAILLIPVASLYFFGLVIGKRREGIVLIIACAALWALGLIFSILFNEIPFESLEGKELRFEHDPTLIWTESTTATSNGSVNAMISSLNPITGGIALLNILSGEIIFGGVGVGLVGLLMYVILTVFLAGLMVGRTPEYLGKKIEKREIKLAMLILLLPSLLILVGTSLSLVLPEGLFSVSAKGPHGLSEVLYAFASAAGNNGSAFAGLNANTPYYNIVLGVVMLLGRLTIIVPTLFLADLLVRKKATPPTAGTFPTDSPLFAILLCSIIIIMAALTFFPVISLGPFAEQVALMRGNTF